MATHTPAARQITSGLRFPEGPMAMPDGSVILVEINRQTFSRVTPDGRIHVVANLGGGPNERGHGPRGRISVANNAGFTWVKRRGTLVPGIPGIQGPDYTGGRIPVVGTCCPT